MLIKVQEVKLVITARGLFGLEFREAQTPESDITATSNLGASFSGEVILNTPEVDPTSGITELSVTPHRCRSHPSNDPCALKDGKIAGG